MSVESRKEKYLLSLICVTAIAFFIIFYFVIARGDLFAVNTTEFSKNLIIEVIGSLMILPVVFFLLESRGINLNPNTKQEIDINDLTDRILEQLSVKLTLPTEIKNVIAFYPNWRDFDWGKQLEDVKELEIIVSFWSDWVDSYMDQLTAIFDRDGKISIVLPSPADNEAVISTCRMFPEYNHSEMQRQIELTVVKLLVAYEKSTAQQKQIEVKYYPGRLNYAAVRFDRNKLYYGFYEHFREFRISSSACLLDLTKDKVLQNFWNKEFTEFNNICRIISLAEMRTLRESIKSNENSLGQ